jgi:hypothetical protein
MPPPLRLEIAGALYHVPRADCREPIVDEGEDCDAWLTILAEALDRFHATTYAYCLIGNHYHIALRRTGRISRA